MRSSQFGIFGAMAAAALVGAGGYSRRRAPEDDGKPEPPDEIERRREMRAAYERGEREVFPARREPPPRILTEADNTRLREAAEKRWRKAQRQAKGMCQAPTPVPNSLPEQGD